VRIFPGYALYGAGKTESGVMKGEAGIMPRLFAPFMRTAVRIPGLFVLFSSAAASFRKRFRSKPAIRKNATLYEIRCLIPFAVSDYNRYEIGNKAETSKLGKERDEQRWRRK
jgi:hypothetical protein